MTSDPLPSGKNSADLDDLEKWLWGGGRSPYRGDAYMLRQINEYLSLFSPQYRNKDNTSYVIKNHITGVYRQSGW